MTPRRYYSIDAIKGLMIIFIVLHHNQCLSFLHHGYLAVDAFFWIAGGFLLLSFVKHQGTAVHYTYQRVRKLIIPYFIAFSIACILDFKHLLSFRTFDELMTILTPFSAFLSFTEELGALHHSFVVLVGGWFLSVLIISGFLLFHAGVQL